IDDMRSGLRRMGFSYDWERELATCDASYYKWNQWLFLKMFEKGLAYKKASAVKSFHQHAFPVQIGKSQGTMHLVAAFFPGEIFHGLKERRGNLRVVNEVNLRETHPVGVPFFIGPVAEDRADAPYDFTIPKGQETLGLAVGESRIFIRIPIAQVISIGSRDEVRIIGIKLVWKIHKPAEFRAAFHLFNGDHESPPLSQN
ncbi:MAG: hypothetical protein EOM66_02800, partial [Clostridia bacterium]|nr:hypothetical protein [Clostridia bacterium]